MQKLRPYLQLMRLPAVFTAMADILLGFLMTHSSLLVDDCPLPFCLLLLSSSSLYLAGMIFNDVFDRFVDAKQRPSRPIPSGQVSTPTAVKLGVGLLVTGVVAAIFVGLNAVLVAVILIAAIFAYDGLLKKTFFGPAAMGVCRFLNVMLGCSALSLSSEIWTAPKIYVAAALGIYIVGVTWFARQESEQSDRRQLGIGVVILNAGLCGLLYLAINEEHGVGGQAAFMRVASAWFIIAMVINRPVTKALLTPSPQRVKLAVRTMIQWLILLDATLIYAATGEPIYAIATAALLGPTLWVGRWLYVT